MSLLDSAYETSDLSPGERCATCRRELPRVIIGPRRSHLAIVDYQETAWIDEDIEGVFCRGCYWRWFIEEFSEVQAQIEELPDNPFALQVVRALVRRGGVISIAEVERQAKWFADLDLPEYERSPVWRRRRQAFIESRRELRCELCLGTAYWNGRRNLPLRFQVHHRTYVRKGAELDSDLALLCEPCHPQ